jgi:hypothetical protein
MVDGVLQAAKHLIAETIAGYPDYEKVIGTFIEYEFDRNARVRAAEYRGKGPLLLICHTAQSKVARVDLDYTAYSSTVPGQAFDECRKSSTPFV